MKLHVSCSVGAFMLFILIPGLSRRQFPANNLEHADLHVSFVGQSCYDFLSEDIDHTGIEFLLNRTSHPRY